MDCECNPLYGGADADGWRDSAADLFLPIGLGVMPFVSAAIFDAFLSLTLRRCRFQQLHEMHIRSTRTTAPTTAAITQAAKGMSLTDIDELGCASASAALGMSTPPAELAAGLNVQLSVKPVDSSVLSLKNSTETGAVNLENFKGNVELEPNMFGISPRGLPASPTCRASCFANECVKDPDTTPPGICDKVWPATCCCFGIPMNHLHF